MSLVGIIQRYKKPVLVADGLCWFRYFLLEQESRIRVSGTTTFLERGLQTNSAQVLIRCRPITTLALLTQWCLQVPACSAYISERSLNSAASSVASLALTVKNMPEKKQFERLPVNVIPKSYDLFLKPNLKTFVFEGKVTIQVVVSEQSKL